MAKIINAVKECEIFKVVCQNPPCDLEKLKHTLRSTALEGDRAIIKVSATSGDSYKVTVRERS